MRVALGQIDVLIADTAGIAVRIKQAAAEAVQQGAELLVLPELISCGYPPRDLLNRRRVVEAQAALVEELATSLPLPTCLGCVEAIDDGLGPALANSLVFIADGQIQARYRKRLLPTYDVFDERRYFRRGDAAGIVQWQGKRIGLSICEDIWTADQLGFAYDVDPVADLAGHCDLVINIAASPFHLGKHEQRRELLANVAKRVQAPLVYVNQVGAHDELLFDGDSACYAGNGACLGNAGRWDERVLVIDTSKEDPGHPQQAVDRYVDLQHALAGGIRDYCRKTRQNKVVLGLSGGIDSAVVAALAVDALGPDAVTGILMPGPYSSAGSVDDAEALVNFLGIKSFTCPISAANDALLEVLAGPFAGLPANVAEENVQARLRGIIVMAYANKHNAMALTTGNKSELAVGYCTIYGDMNGGLAPIGDVYKTEVFALARAMNAGGERIPVATIEKPPSAELRPDQKDTDSLPPYDELDAMLESYLEEDAGIADLIAAGYAEETVRRIIRLVEVNEYKRRQAAPSLRVTTKAFGVGRRIPLARALE